MYLRPIKVLEDKIIYIKSGSSIKDISKNLKEKNLIKNNVLFKTILFISGKDKNILHGEY